MSLPLCLLGGATAPDILWNNPSATLTYPDFYVGYSALCRALRPYLNIFMGQNYSTPPGGMGVGWNSKWVGWIPPVTIPNPDQPTLAIFLTHHYFCTEKEWIQIMILSIFGILGEKVKLSSRTCLLHLVPQINLVFSHFGDCSRALDSWEKLYPPPQEKRLQNCPIDLKAHAHL